MNEAVLVLLGAAGSILAGLAALAGARSSRRAGVAADEREARRDEAVARRDTIADRDSLIDQLQEQCARLEVRVGRIEDENTALRKQLELEQTWSLILRDHIAHGRGWPPPPRPVSTDDPGRSS